MMRRQTRERSQFIIHPSAGRTPTTPPEFLVRVQGTDGKSEASIPIWVPLSIMAASAARSSGQTESVAQVVADAVTSHGNLIAQKRYSASPAAAAYNNIDIMGHITMASRKASHALLRAGGSSQAAAAVEEAIKGGGALLVPTLNSRQTILLDRSESRNDGESKTTTTKYRTRGSDPSPRMGNDDERGVHYVGSDAEDATSNNVSFKSKQVSWVDNGGRFGNNTYAINHVQGGSLLSGKDIYLDRPGQRKPQKQEKQQQKTKQPSHQLTQQYHQRSAAPRHIDRSSTNSFTIEDTSTVASEYEGGGFCVEIGEGLVDNERDGTINSDEYHGGCMIVDAADELNNQTFKPINLLPQWEARTMADSITIATRDTARSTIAPLVNLFLPVPREQRDPNERKANSRFVGDDDEVEDEEDEEDASLMDIQDSWTIHDSWTKNDASSYTGTYEGTLHAEDMSQEGSRMSRESSRGDTSAHDTRTLKGKTSWGNSTVSDVKTLDKSEASRGHSSTAKTDLRALGKSNASIESDGISKSGLEIESIDNMDMSFSPETDMINDDHSEQNDLIVNDNDAETASHYGTTVASHYAQSTVASYSTGNYSGGQRTMTTRTVLSMQSNKGGFCYWKCPGMTYFQDVKSIESNCETDNQSAWESMPAVWESMPTIMSETSLIETDTVPTTSPTPDDDDAPAAPVPEKESTFKKMKLAFGRLNCGARKKERLGRIPVDHWEV